ncbi:ankyrin repeat domain-containing protein 49-like [Arctopsyche grandis]|uniref:ankyrin repeat domain-containing protein 49-like n=1 Tax=Arctopsyche grandis TaxID=121162 RepID=UPI00406D63CB
MGDISSDEERDVLNPSNMSRLSEEIKKKKNSPETRGMFVSGWDDADADQGVTEETNPHETPEKEILWAAENGKVDVLRSLLESNSELNNVIDDDSYTPLHRACYNNHLDIIDVLLSYGANVSARTKMGWQPLHSACHWNHPDCIGRLFAAGADVNAHSSGDQTPLHIATSLSHCWKMVQLILLHPDIDPFVLNKTGDVPKDIARRSGVHEYLFDMAAPAITYIKSQEFTVNPYIDEHIDE